MKRVLSLLVAPVAVFVLSGCFGAGMFPGDEAHQNAAMRNVSQRVPFDLGCKDAQLTRLGDVNRLGQQMTSMSIGVVCGEKRATYTVLCVSNWGNITCTPTMNTVGVTEQQP
jgi:hypothetical protein